MAGPVLSWTCFFLLSALLGIAAKDEGVEHHIGRAFCELIHRMLWVGSGTITKCLRLRHFRCFPQIDAGLEQCHLIAPRSASVHGEIPESRIGSSACWARASNREVASLRAK